MRQKFWVRTNQQQSMARTWLGQQSRDVMALVQIKKLIGLDPLSERF